MSTLGLKRRRDIGRQKGQYIAVLVAVVLGVTLFAGSYNAYLNLGRSLDGSYDRLGTADMTLSGGGSGLVDAVAGVEGVEETSERLQIDVPMVAGDDSFLGRLVTMPPDEQPTINAVDVDKGAYLSSDEPDGVLLETHAAADFELEVGDTMQVAGRDVTVRGVVTSTEYLWPARDSQSLFTPPKSFGVVFVAESFLPEPAEIPPQVLVRYEDGVDIEETDAAVIAAADAAGFDTTPERLADQASNQTIELEISALRTMAIALPLLFLAAAGMAIYVVVTRLVYQQRGVIGTLRASGFSRAQMSRHYRLYGVTVGVVGAAIGVLLGEVMARVMTGIYTRVFGIPDLVARFHFPTVVAALAFGVVAGMIASAPPARAVGRLEPAEAMRADNPASGGRSSIFESLIPPLRQAPVRWRMTLRGLGRNKKRSTSMVLGVVLGMTLIMASWGMLDSMLLAMDRQFNEIATEDVTVVLDQPVTDDAVGVIADIDGVGAAEPVVGLRAEVTGGSEGETYLTQLEGYQQGTVVRGFDEPLPSDGIVLGHALEGLLGVEEGDDVELFLPQGSLKLTVPIRGFVEEPLGTLVYMRDDVLRDAIEDAGASSELLMSPSVTTVKAVFADGVDADAVQVRVEAVSGVVAVISSSEIRDLVDDFQAFFYLFVGMMLVFGGAMAFALIFNIISVNVTERSSEFASMRANGLTHRRVAALIMGETTLLTAIGAIPGLVVGYIAAAAFLGTFSGPEFPVALEMRNATYVGSVLVMFVVAGLSLIPAVRAVKRIDVAEIVRERST